MKVTSEITFNVFPHSTSNPASYQQATRKQGLMKTSSSILPSNPVQQHSLSSLTLTSKNVITFCKIGGHTSRRGCRPHIDCCFRCCPLKVPYLPALKYLPTESLTHAGTESLNTILIESLRINSYLLISPEQILCCQVFTLVLVLIYLL